MKVDDRKFKPIPPAPDMSLKDGNDEPVYNQSASYDRDDEGSLWLDTDDRKAGIRNRFYRGFYVRGLNSTGTQTWHIVCPLPSVPETHSNMIGMNDPTGWPEGSYLSLSRLKKEIDAYWEKKKK